MKKSNKGFTLIELLAVITIMAILMIVGISAIIKTIETSRKGVFEKSVGGIERAAKLESKTNAVDGEELLYKYSDGSWEELDLEIDGELPKYVEIKVKEENKVRYAITDGRYCAVKEYDGEMTIKRIGDKNTSSMVEEKYCELDAVIGTTEDCFETSENSDGTITIKAYYNYEGNDSSNPACPRNVIIPNKIDGKIVTIIGEASFAQQSLTSVVIPNTITEIQVQAFRNNGLTQVIIPEGVKNIGDNAFLYNQLKDISLPSTLVTIAANAFRNNQLPQESAYIYKRNSDGSIDYTTIIGYGGASKAIEIPGEKNGVKLTTIGPSSFAQQSLTSVVIPNTVTNIGSQAFMGDKITNLVIPKGVTSIGTNAFHDNPLTTVTIKNTSDRVTIASNAFGSFDTNNIVWQPDV